MRLNWDRLFLQRSCKIVSLDKQLRVIFYQGYTKTIATFLNKSSHSSADKETIVSVYVKYEKGGDSHKEPH